MRYQEDPQGHLRHQEPPQETAAKSRPPSNVQAPLRGARDQYSSPLGTATPMGTEEAKTCTVDRLKHES
ncbi:hypothetical protein N7478_010588 [Penicillium angulare]|uniref:uncharacterized protein n=1 Tax=Penicillium angulare TaxID=116970 RepID=UPI00254020BC|nr:uncharacterized protein N7478_010588 [Penicillium angulare]KAJ5267780.1 hypothetical protein N7478_010588 [Penicillium angulare]